MCDSEPELLTLEQVADRANLDPCNLAWAVQECGRCDGPDHVIVPAGHADDRTANRAARR
jgi:hypothetical protein